MPPFHAELCTLYHPHFHPKNPPLPLTPPFCHRCADPLPASCAALNSALKDCRSRGPMRCGSIAVPPSLRTSITRPSRAAIAATHFGSAAPTDAPASC